MAAGKGSRVASGCQILDFVWADKRLGTVWDVLSFPWGGGNAELLSELLRTVGPGVNTRHGWGSLRPASGEGCWGCKLLLLTV